MEYYCNFRSVMRTIIDAVFFFIGLGFTEAVVKPIAKKWVQRRIVESAPVVLKRVDAILPELVKVESPDEIESMVKSIAKEVTGEDWNQGEVDLLFELFDLRKSVIK